MLIVAIDTEEKQAEHDAFAALWQNDGESDVCPLCMIKFTTLRRKVPTNPSRPRPFKRPVY